MSFLEKLKQPLFWSNFVKVALPFFIVVILFSLFINSWREIFSGDFVSVSKANFDNGKWINFFSFKFLISVLYGLYLTNRNMK